MSEYDEIERRVYNCIRQQTPKGNAGWAPKDQVQMILGNSGYAPHEIQQAIHTLVRDDRIEADRGTYRPVDDYRIPHPGET